MRTAVVYLFCIVFFICFFTFYSAVHYSGIPEEKSRIALEYLVSILTLVSFVAVGYILFAQVWPE